MKVLFAALLLTAGAAHAQVSLPNLYTQPWYHRMVDDVNTTRALEDSVFNDNRAWQQQQQQQLTQRQQQLIEAQEETNRRLRSIETDQLLNQPVSIDSTDRSSYNLLKRAHREVGIPDHSGRFTALLKQGRSKDAYRLLDLANAQLLRGSRLRTRAASVTV